MTDNQTEDAFQQPEKAFAGFSEIDQAIRDNRLMEYRIKKSWADPWGRKLTVLGSGRDFSSVLFLSWCVSSGSGESIHHHSFTSSADSALAP
jgi:hypothetical protein